MGQQVLVNHYHNNWQRESDMLALANGGFLVVWSSYVNDYGDEGFVGTIILGRRFDGQGRPVGQNRIVNANVDFLDQYGIEAVTLTNGRVLAIWNSEDTFRGPNGSSDFEIRGSLFSATGEPIRSDVHLTRNVGVISAFGQGAHFDVTPLAGGGFAIAHFEYGFRFGMDAQRGRLS